MTLRSVSFSVAVLAAFILVAVIVHRQNLEAFAANGSNAAPAGIDRSSVEARTPVLVELFTSEGCSSCPPADALLSQLGRTQPVPGARIIALEEHVDYWDRLGWKDPFSSEGATERQTDYGQAFGGEQIYTPQMVVDGRTEFAGSSDGDALRVIRAASQSPKPKIELAWQSGDSLSIHIDALPNADSHDAPQLVVAVTENRLRSDVKRGENAGRALEHNGVVRELFLAGKITGAAAGFSTTVPIKSESRWNRANLLAVVFVQERRSRHILAAETIAFAKAS